MSDLLIIIPAYKRRKSIENVINNIIKNYPQYDYVGLSMIALVIRLTPKFATRIITMLLICQ